jgi:hypothetical protein
LDRVDNPDNHRDDAAAWDVERLAGAIAFTVDQHGVSNAGMRIVQGQEVSGLVTVGIQRLDHQQATILVMGVADRGHHRPDDFPNDHGRTSGELIEAGCQGEINPVTHVEFVHYTDQGKIYRNESLIPHRQRGFSGSHHYAKVAWSGFDHIRGYLNRIRRLKPLVEWLHE